MARHRRAAACALDDEAVAKILHEISRLDFTQLNNNFTNALAPVPFFVNVLKQKVESKSSKT